MPSNPISKFRGSQNPDSLRHTPLLIIHIFGNFLRIWSVYSIYSYLSQTRVSAVLFILSCLVPSTFIFLALQKPWKGRPLSNAQIVSSIVNGAITALYFIFWVKGVKSCGPLSALMAEYSGAVLGVLSGILYGHVWKKVYDFNVVNIARRTRGSEIGLGINWYSLFFYQIGGLLAMLTSFYFLSQGWATSTFSPFYNFDMEGKGEPVLGIKRFLIPVLAGILSALRRVIARRASIKNQIKRRLHPITIASATCFVFPVAMWDIFLGESFRGTLQYPFPTWPFLSTTLFGIILIFYVDSVAEERLHLVFSSPKHLMIAGGCITIFEIAYKTDFSLPGFIICSLILGFGIYEATSLDYSRSGSSGKDKTQMESLPT